MAGKARHLEINGVDCIVCFTYDPVTRTEEDYVLLDTGVEQHRRIPLDPDDIAAAVPGSCLVLAEHFSSAGFGLRRSGGVHDFYILTQGEQEA